LQNRKFKNVNKLLSRNDFAGARDFYSGGDLQPKRALSWI
jgi:hypothetical protein